MLTKQNTLCIRTVNKDLSILAGHKVTINHSDAHYLSIKIANPTSYTPTLPEALEHTRQPELNIQRMHK